MKPVDKFGRPIYQHIFRKLQEYGKLLELYGYRESIQKPNLFYRTCGIVIFYADMRGTEIVPIWENPSPLFYWNWRKANLDAEIRSRTVLIECLRISKMNVRLSFECDEYEDIRLLRKRHMVSFP